ncbi:unnamed protein product [Urochloa decumbens]
MESSEAVPLDPEDVHRGSPWDTSDRRKDTGQRLVHRMPKNPKIIAFESTQHRFEVPLRPDLWSSSAMSGVPVSHHQLQPTPPISRKRIASGGTRRTKKEGIEF